MHELPLKKILVTGSAGFIGFHLCRLLLQQGFIVAGYDGITPYYDQVLKRRRHAMLMQYSDFTATEAMLEDDAALTKTMDSFGPDAIVHLAAQAGVRHSLEFPRAYIDANLVGTFNVLEAARKTRI